MGYKILTIDREFGTRGYGLATMLSEELQISVYDHGMIRMMLKNPNFERTIDVRNYTRRPDSLLYNLGTYRNSKFGCFIDVDDTMANMEFGMIRRLAEQGPCIILGRCANYILKNRPDVFSVFIKGDEDSKRNRIRELVGNMDSDDMDRMIKRTDIARGNYYQHHTKCIWGDAKDYDMILDHRNMTPEQMYDFLKEKLDIQQTYRKTYTY